MNLRHITAVVLLVVTQAASATERYYRDSVVQSPNGRYSLSATSPENADPSRPRPFARDFTYTLTDVQTKKVLWTRKQPAQRQKGSLQAYASEGSPMRTFVNDDGTVALYVSGEDLVLLRAGDGRLISTTNILDAFGTETNAFVSTSSIGPLWTQRSTWYFLSIPADKNGDREDYFVIRPFWWSRVVVNCRTGEPFDCGGFNKAASATDLADAKPEVKRVMGACIELEKSTALTNLARRLEDVRASDWHEVREIESSIQTVIHQRLKEAQPLLRALEDSIGSQRRFVNLGPRISEGLRALGHVPRLTYIPHSSPPQVIDLTEKRDEKAERVKVGMKLDEIVELLGPPDADLWGVRSYDFDIDSTDPYTLRVTIDVRTQVTSTISRIRPLAFFDDPDRLGN